MAGSACATTGSTSSEPLGLLSAVHKDQKLATASRLGGFLLLPESTSHELTFVFAALHNYHILDSASPLARSLSSSAVHQFGGKSPAPSRTASHRDLLYSSSRPSIGRLPSRI